MECKIEITVFLWNYLYKNGVVLRGGRCKGCGVVSDGSTMAVYPCCDIGNGGWGVYIRFNAVVRSVLLASVGCSSVVHEGCFVQ